LRLQYLQQRVLQKAVARNNATSGSIVTLDAKTGEVLAMVNYPVYNPNNRKNMRPADMRNRAMTDVYEPGSTMKALTLVAALESGKYTTSTMIDTSPGTIRVGRKLLRDHRNYGEISVSRIVEKSSQVGITKIAQDIGYQPIWNVFNRFGIGQSPGTGFPGESSGLLPTRPKWHAIEKVTLAFGYGLTATPLQLAHAFSVFANEGLQQPISLLALDGEQPPGNPVITPELAHEVLEVLHSVTGKNGTAQKARIPGYAVGGKTGTVHKVAAGGYAADKYVALFAGIAPIENPRIVTVVVINEPKGEAHGGGSVAAPIFASVVEGALRLLNVAPTETGTAVAAGASAAKRGAA
jgi:cell division protein FtsI (penicillin-binding protein 3)